MGGFVTGITVWYFNEGDRAGKWRMGAFVDDSLTTYKFDRDEETEGEVEMNVDGRAWYEVVAGRPSSMFCLDVNEVTPLEEHHTLTKFRSREVALKGDCTGDGGVEG